MNLKHKKNLKVGLIFGLIAYGIFLLIEVSLFFINEEKSMSDTVFCYGFIVLCLVIGFFLEYTFEAKPQKRHVDAGNIEQEILDRKKIRMLERAKELKGQRLSLDRQNHLKKILPLYRKLPDSLKPKLEERILLFQEMVKFESHPKRSTEITQHTRDMVSAEACLLIIHRSPTDYLLLEYIELWSSKPKDWEGEVLGDANYRIVRLDLKALERYVNDGEDGFNIVLHEFAHVLDFADDKIANSIPVSKDSNDYLRWKTLLDREYPKLQAAHEQRINPLLREYAVSSPTRAEFFSCATESFFERPVMLKKENPEIYYLLGYYYVLDPAEWIEGQ